MPHDETRGLDDTFRKRLNVRNSYRCYSQIHFIIMCHRVSDKRDRALLSKTCSRPRTLFDIIVVFHKAVKDFPSAVVFMPVLCQHHGYCESVLCLRSLYTQVRSMFSIFIVTRRFHRSMRTAKNTERRKEAQRVKSKGGGGKEGWRESS